MTRTGKCFLIIIFSIIVGFLLLFAAYHIPAHYMQDECFESVNHFSKEGTYPKEKFSGRQLDYFTDCIMLLESAFPDDKSIVDQTINSYYNSVSGINPCLSFIQIYSHKNAEIETVSYSRYWHGYQAILRLLYAKFNYLQIIKINLCFQYVLLLIVLYKLYKTLPYCLFPFLVMTLFLAPTAIGRSLQFSSVYYVALSASLFLLLNSPRGSASKKTWIVFLISGIVTSYLDLLTAPTLSLTIPLCILCAQICDNNNRKNSMLILAQCTLMWFIGYAGMWAGKWLLCILFNGPSYLFSIVDRVLLHTSSSEIGRADISKLDALVINVKELFTTRDVSFLCSALTAILLIDVLSKHKTISRSCFRNALLFLLPAAIPLVWILILKNHSYVHFWFTYRSLAPILLCILCALGKMCQNPNGSFGPIEKTSI